MNTVAEALESNRQVDRRTFFKRFAQVAGIMAAATGTCAVTPPSAEAFFSFGPKVDPRWKPLVSALKDYVTGTYVKRDDAKVRTASGVLRQYGMTENDLIPLQNINRCLLPKNMFLTYHYFESSAVVPVVKLFLVAGQDVFDGFVVDGQKRTTLFGKKMDSYGRVLLGKEIFSTVDAPPVALPYNLAPPGSSIPNWIIAIPSGWIEEIYGSRASGIQERLMEELTVHEITHIVYRTRDELLPFLAQFGYRMDDDRPITGVHELIDYLTTKRLTYHQAERLILERIYYADAYYGSSGNTTHMSALKQIKDELSRISQEINRQCPQYPRNILKISDQQCYGSMALLYHQVVRQFAMGNNMPGGPFM